MFQGDWYVAAANDQFFEKKGKCGKIAFTYQKEDNKMDGALTSRFSGVSSKDSTPIAFESFFLPIITDKVANHYAVFRAEGTNTYSDVYKQSIIATDYTSYALYIACKPTFDATSKTFGRNMYAEIWARQGVTLSKDTIDTLTNVLASYDIEPANIKMTEGKC